MTGIKIKDVTAYLESIAPRAYQESYDNAGLITGDPDWTVTGVLVTLDCTEAVLKEAKAMGCNLVVAHHPIVFRGLKKLTGSNYVERTVIMAVKNDIAIYAIHTNLDNIYTGVNRKICDKLGLTNMRILLPKKDTLSKLVTFVPETHADVVLAALHDAGAGQIGAYKNCSFTVDGRGSFLPVDGANPTLGEVGEQTFTAENRIEVIVPSHLEQKVMSALKKNHPYEEVAYYFSTLTNENQEVGSGMMGDLPEPLEPFEFLKRLKVSMDLKVVRHTPVLNKPLVKVAVCGGSGSFLLPQAIQAGADIFVTADFKYHEFFDADNAIIIADIGHYESEAFTKELLQEVLNKKFTTFAINFSKTVTNPISYF